MPEAETATVARRDAWDADLVTVYRESYAKLVRLAYLLTGHAAVAEEIVQEAFLALWRDPVGVDPGRGSVRAWLMGMVHHRAVDAVRREVREDKLTFNVGLIGGGATAEFDAGRVRINATGKTNITPGTAIARGAWADSATGTSAG